MSGNRELIEKRLAHYKAEREAWLVKQKSYKWTAKEKEDGSPTYGYYQEQENIFTVKIMELEWVLNLFPADSTPSFNPPNKDGIYKRNASFDM